MESETVWLPEAVDIKQEPHTDIKEEPLDCEDDVPPSEDDVPVLDRTQNEGFDQNQPRAVLLCQKQQICTHNILTSDSDCADRLPDMSNLIPLPLGSSNRTAKTLSVLNISILKEELTFSDGDSEKDPSTFLSDVMELKNEQSSATAMKNEYHAPTQNEDSVLKFDKEPMENPFETVKMEEILPDTSDVIDKISAQSSHLVPQSDEARDEIQRGIRRKELECRYSCNICNKVFTQSGSLNRHILIHTGQRPYKCEICNKSFTEKGTLKTHERLHTGLRPYTCEICKKSFTRHGGLTIHMLTHTDQRPYICEICEKSFTRNADLERHIHTHTGQRAI